MAESTSSPEKVDPERHLTQRVDPPAPPLRNAAPIELTVDFQREPATRPPRPSGTNDPPAASLSDQPFLEPPRGGEELGWLAHYRVEKLIGSGGMGLVYRAEDSQLGRPVALKVIRPEHAASSDASARFAREARAAAAIKHDHVVTIYQVGEASGVSFLAMEYLQGISLQSWLDRGRKTSVDLILRIGREVASGLIAAHKLGLVHRDIKPANIWLEAPSGRAKILDFGQVRAEREDVQITHSGAIMGTPAYMSPEQAAGIPVGPASDLFSLGCVLYRMACGRLPFEGETILSVLNALATVTPRPAIETNPDLPEDLSRLISQLLQKQPELRPASAQAVFDRLRSIERQIATQRHTQVLGNAGSTRDLASLLLVETEPTEGEQRLAPASPAPPTSQRMTWIGFLVGSTLLSSAAALILWFAYLNKAKDQGTSGDPALVAAVTPAGKAVEPDPLSVPPIESPTPVPAPDPEPKKQQHPPVPPAPSLVAPPPIPEVPRPGPIAPPPPPTKPSVAKPPEPTGLEAIWGAFVDPSGDCRLEVDQERGTTLLKIPGTAHLLSAEFGKENAPRTKRAISGDFQADLHVSGTEHVGGRVTTKEFPPYHGGGLLLWQDAGNYVRLEIATDIVKGKPRHYSNFEYRQGSKLVVSRGQASSSGSASLRLVRMGDRVTGSFSADGKRWISFPSLPVTLAPDLEIGLVGINSSSKPLEIEFHDFRIKKELALPK